MILYCVRHGETVFNASGRIQGQSNSDLSPLGHRQCEAVAQALADAPIDAIYASPLTRALDSARCIAEPHRLEPRIEARLMEINAGVFQGLDWDQIERQYPAAAERWKSHDPDFQIPDGESRRDLMKRAFEVFCAIREAGHRQAIVVSHGGLLSAALKALLEIPAQRNPFSLNNGSISKIGWDKDVKLLTLNQTDHLHGAQGGGGEL